MRIEPHLYIALYSIYISASAAHSVERTPSVEAQAPRPWTALLVAEGERAANMGETPMPIHGHDARATQPLHSGS
jgi:hypothetical protein